MFLTQQFLPAAPEMSNLTQHESALLLWVVGGLVSAVIALIILFWSQMNKKVGKLDDTATAILCIQAGTNKEIENLKAADARIEAQIKSVKEDLEKDIEEMGGRTKSLERTLSGFMSPPRQGGLTG